MARTGRRSPDPGVVSGDVPASAGTPGRGAPWWRRLLSALRPHRNKVIVALVAAAIGQAVAALTPLVERHILDEVIGVGHAALAPWVVALVVAGVIRFGAAFVRRYAAGRVSLDVQYDLRTAIYANLQRLDFARHDELATGQLVSRASSDVGLVQGLLSFLPLVLANVLFFVIAFVIMLTLSPLLTLVVLAVTPVLLVLSLKMRAKVFPASWDAQQQAGVVAGVVEEDVTGVRVVKGFGQERRELDRFAGAAEGLFASRLRAIRIQARYQPALQAIPVLGQAAVLGLGGWLAIHAHVSLGTFYAFAAYMTALQAPVRMLAGLLAVGQQARAGVERIYELLDSTPLVDDKPGADDLPSARGEVHFEHVGFGYLRSEPVVKGFDLTVAPGETVALVGTSGSGKSTVALLVPRFYDVQSGAITIDGVDVRDITMRSLRRQVGVVFEDSFLFSDSVRANIAYGVPDATDAEVEAAARAAEADGFISALPHGYDTVVGEQGLTLSGGQRQRVALARALLTDPRILVLDDATSAVDTRVEEEIHATLRRLLAGRSTILVAHRRSTLRLADRIVVVDHGRVVDSGTYGELQERCGLFRLLLSGPGEDAEAVDALAAPDEAPQVDGITPALWHREDEDADEETSVPGRPVAAGTRAGMAPGVGRRGGLGGGIGRADAGGIAAALAPTPELLAALDTLPPADDVPDSTPEEAFQPDPRFKFVRYLRRWRGALSLALFLVAFDGLLTLSGPALVRWGIDHGVTPMSESALWIAVGLFALVTLVDWVVTVGETIVAGRTAERVLYALRLKAFGQLQRLSLDYYDREMAGRIMTRLTTDVEALTQLLQTGLVSAVVSILTCGGVAVALVIMNARLALVTMTIVPPLVIATIWFKRASAQAYEQARDRVAVVNADFQEGLSGVRVAQAFVREGRNTERFAGAARGYLEARLRAQTLVATYFPFIEFLSEVAAALVLGYGAALVRDGSLSTGAVVAFLLYLDLFFSPIQQLSQVFDTYQQAAVGIDRITQLLATPVTTPEAEHPIPVEHLAGEVRFDDVRFAYPNTGVEALRGVTFEIETGQTVAFVGETGAGKSTVLKLVARFYDVTAGAVRIDGLDVRDLDLAEFRHHLGIVPQEAFLFTGTIRDNIAYGRPSATDAEVEAAARAVGAHAVIAGLPGGYLHVVGERGRSLSSGQRQLIALARALLVDPSVLLLDEATANLDLATEARVSAAMGAVAQGRTTLLIAHRLPTAARAERIIVLDQGGVVEDGSHDALLAEGGTYAALWAAYEGADVAA